MISNANIYTFYTIIIIIIIIIKNIFFLCINKYIGSKCDKCVHLMFVFIFHSNLSLQRISGLVRNTLIYVYIKKYENFESNIYILNVLYINHHFREFR